MKSSSLCRIVVLISGSGTNLQAIVDAAKNGQFAGEVVGVISNNAGAYGLTRAQQASIPTQLLKHSDYSSRQNFEQALAQSIDGFQPDLIILAGFMRILGSAFVQHYTGKMLNIHPSLLPKYQGLHTHQRALEAGDKYHGVSIHFVTEELDGGPLIAQQKIAILENDNQQSLAQRVQKIEYILYPKVIGWFCESRLQLTEQGAELDGSLIKIN